MDLRATAGRQPQLAIRGIVALVPPTDRERGADAQALARLIVRQGARLEHTADLPLADALQLAASQPHANLPAFVCATAILLADRLQHGLLTADLATFWDSFRSTYFDLDAHDRSAIVQGFLAVAHAEGATLTLPLPERTTESGDEVQSDLRALAARDGTALTSAVTETMDDVTSTLSSRHMRSLLAGTGYRALTGDDPVFAPLLSLASTPGHPVHIAATALLLAEAVASGDSEGWFAVTLWADRINEWLALDNRTGRVILAGLRHLYESDPHWAPAQDRRANPKQAAAIPLLPVLDASYTGGNSGARVG